MSLPSDSPYGEPPLAAAAADTDAIMVSPSAVPSGLESTSAPPTSDTSSAASLLRAAHTLASHAASGTQAIEAISTTLRTQAAAAGFLPNPTSLSDAPSSSASANPYGLAMATSLSEGAGARRASSSFEYAAAMSAQMSRALSAQAAAAAASASSSTAPPPPPPPLQGSAAQTRLPEVAASISRPESPRSATERMGEIAVRAAALEGEAQIRVHAMLRNASSTSSPSSSTSTLLPAPPSMSPTGLAARRASAGHASLNLEKAREESMDAEKTPTVTKPNYLDQLGLAHIKMPSLRMEQWNEQRMQHTDARAEANERGGAFVKRKQWEVGDPRMGFNLAGVPSLPLMPTPPLQMLPPPTTYATNARSHLPTLDPYFPFTPLSGPTFSSGTANSPGSPLAPSLPYPFQIVQTPGGTARAGWWIPPEHVPLERRKGARRVSEGIGKEAKTELGERARGRVRSVLGELGESQEKLGEEEEELLFQPAYRELQPDEYAVLASAAAYATAALTTTTSSTPIDGIGSNSQHSTAAAAAMSGDAATTAMRPLSPEEQAVIATQLRAWAGLEGPQRQAEARTALEEHQAAVLLSSTPIDGTVEHHASSSQHAPTAPTVFPPDFASHYRTQLRALAEGYYTRLHKDQVAKSHLAPGVVKSAAALAPPALPVPHPGQSVNTQEPRSSGALSSTFLANVEASQPPEQQQHHKRQRQQQPELPTRRTSLAEAARHQLNLPSPAEAASGMLSGVTPTMPPVPAGIAPSTPSGLEPGGQDPVALINAASNAAGVGVHDATVRDQLLQYAHGLYSTGSTTTTSPDGSTTTRLHPTLLPLLHTLHKLHPQHLPTLLLLSCAYFTAGDMPASLYYNSSILKLDPNYAEAMSNLATTLRHVARYSEAESWWWRAIKLRPSYFDAFENLLGVYCAPQPGSEQTAPRFEEALRLCEFVEAHVLRDGGRTRSAVVTSPQCLPAHMPVAQIARLQNLLYAKGNLKFVLPELGLLPAAREYERSIEIVMSPSPQQAVSLRDLVISTYVVGLLVMGATLPGSQPMAAAQVARVLDIDPSVLLQQGSNVDARGILTAVRRSGEEIVNVLLQIGGGQLPMLMLLPDSAVSLVKLIFAETEGILPALYSSSVLQLQQVQRSGAMSIQQQQQQQQQHQQAVQQASQTTSTIILTLAKLFQDVTANPSSARLTLGGIPPSTSLLLPLYYLALSLHPSASTANNLGILLSSIPIVAYVNNNGQRQQVNGQSLAMHMYTYGLNLDAKHPHLYTNLGSLLKDLGHLGEAIQMYEKALEFSEFDVALANLANAVKDQGRTQDAIPLYRRAVKANPRLFPEALAGLTNALLAVCDWREVYPDDQGQRGWMADVIDLLAKQLDEGALYGAGALQAEGTIEDWVDLIVRSTGDTRPATREQLIARLTPFYSTEFDRKALKVNEGSFVIRLIERLLRRNQRRWYLDVYGAQVQQGKVGFSGDIHPTQADVQKYPRVPLPSCLVTPAVPTVLPFHTFTLPVPARHIRLISHRNALRISQTTLTQMWLPPHVYPPPAPPAPRLRVGYVSSDFNNHPLAHLMQSVFGMHDATRYEIFLYATTTSDQSPYRLKIEREAEHFLDVAAWSNQQIIERIVADGIHVLVNLNGYTKGARNEVFAARPCPVQMEFMGFAGGLASGWTDWLIVDPVVCPPETTAVDVWRARRREARTAAQQLVQRPTDFGGDLDPEAEASPDVKGSEWVYTERCLYMPHSYFVCDHRQGFREPEERPALDGEGVVHPHELSEEEVWAEEEQRRWQARKELFPSLPDHFVIMCCFNQLYKLDPGVFKAWLRILALVPNSIIWLLRFPAAGEVHLLRAAREWAGDEVASRLVFTEVAPKGVHIQRGRIADIFLDAWECGAHTTSADILWSGTPVLTWPRYSHKMCSRVAASIVHATGFGAQMAVASEEEYVKRAVELALGIAYDYRDADGKSVKAAEQTQSVTADALMVNTASSSALPHTSHASASTAASTSEALAAQADPAPANVKQAAKIAATQPNADLEEVTPPRSAITLVPGLQAPPQAVTRRGSGELVELRRKLFLTRDKHDGLFDTLAWTRALERGFTEAWRRFVAGTDVDDSPEWEALPEEAPEKLSGHIWL